MNVQTRGPWIELTDEETGEKIEFQNDLDGNLVITVSNPQSVYRKQYIVDKSVRRQLLDSLGSVL